MSRFVISRRGAVSLVFAVCATVLIGMVALAAEAGTWYLVRERAQDAADASAMAAALAYASGASASSAAQDSTLENVNFPSGATVTAVNSPPGNCYVTGSSCSTASTSQFEVYLSAPVTPYLSSLFISGFNVQARSVAGLQSICPSSTGCVCVLSTSGDLTVSSTQNSPECIYASNATDSTSVNIGGSTSVATDSITTVGGCSGCGGGGVNMEGRPYASYQPATPYTQYQAIDTAASGWAMPACGSVSPTYGTAEKASANSSNSTTITVASVAGITVGALIVDTTTSGNIPGGTYVTAAAGTTITASARVNVAANDTVRTVTAVALTAGLFSSTCASDPYFVSSATAPPTFVMSGGNPSSAKTTWTLGPGTYYFSGLSLAIPSGTIQCINGRVACASGSNGVTFVLTGSGTYGNLYICAWSAGSCSGATTASFSGINAQPTASAAVLDGILFYRYNPGSASNGTAAAPAAWIWGNSNTSMSGGMYFPGAFVSYGNPGSTLTCTIVIAGTLTLTGTSTDTASLGCPGTPVPVAQAARIME